jgi:hypothetical protein
VKKSRVTPEGAASILGFLATPTEARILLAGGALLANREADKGETVVLRFGKEADQDKDKKEKPGIFAQHSGSDLLFLVDAGIIKTLKTADLRDRTMLLATQGILNSGALASGPVNMLASLPLLTRTVQTFDPAKVKEVKLEIRTTAELRKFHFVREKDKTWQDQSGLLEFQLNSDKVNSFLEKEMNKLQAERIVAIGSGAKAEYKFGPKEYTLKMDLTLEEGRTITLTVGDAFEREDYFAQTSDWPGVVFLISSSTVDPLLRGAAYFAKERVAGGP